MNVYLKLEKIRVGQCYTTKIPFDPDLSKPYIFKEHPNKYEIRSQSSHAHEDLDGRFLVGHIKSGL